MDNIICQERFRTFWISNFITGLNSLQSGLHRQHMKDLFVELCLTVPVRLSSLLPYLPMLMDPLVSALNGSQTLVSQVSDLYLSHMKDLFVELCLTVPVRLSSLLPYLPMLMDPLVSALNGSQTLVSQVSDHSISLT